MVGFCSSPTFVEHDPGLHHPERPDRIRAIYAALHQAGLIADHPFPETSIDFDLRPTGAAPLQLIEARPACTDVLTLVHSARHVERVRQTCLASGVLDLGDTPVVPQSFDAALLAAGATLACCDAVMNGQVRRAFAAVRPPGHHAEPERSMGFCLFSNLAIAARYLQKHHALERVAIVDFDVHHGNGTQSAFDSDPSVYFVSLHENPRVCYPGSGFDWEIGTGAGRGYTLNVAFDPGAGDQDYMKVIDNRVAPELDEFAPQFLLVSAGFDAHAEDPLAQIELTDDGFELMTRSLVAVAERHCQGRVVSVLEGGYNLKALGRSVVRHLNAMR